MRLLRYGPEGHEKPGMLDAEGRIRALSPAIADLSCEVLTNEGLDVLAAIDPNRLPLVEGHPRLGSPVANPRQFLALGRNYAMHVKEGKNPMPVEPMLFNKAPTCISGAGDDIPLYPGSVALDYETELAFVIGRRAHRIREQDALTHVAGYCICNDVSERDWQLKRGGLIGKGKSAPGYGPLGPWLVTSDEIPNPQVLRIRTRVNGKLRQDASTASMIFPVAKFIAHASEFMVLLPGDVLTTGTPEGVAAGMESPAWLSAGDTVQSEIEGLGTQIHIVRAIAD